MTKIIKPVKTSNLKSNKDDQPIYYIWNLYKKCEYNLYVKQILDGKARKLGKYVIYLDYVLI